MSSEPVSMGKALLRGLAMRCPHCGEGRLFGRYLKVVDACAKCGEEFHHHTADDYPAYLVVAIVGHAVFPIILSVDAAYAPPMWLYALIGIPLIMGSVIGALQPTKGAVVAFQWSLGLFGFEAAKVRRASAPLRG